ncbi:carboxypeptidase regulatory-like domain-containing protein [Natronorubrum tibetense]|uniref:Peptidase S8/S53 subtilisin kexin sedolisin n=1 Tax=Natronorubrum tibetense GA33 TaxID=1114856 RepID=L9VP93_9EURY|nr:carboxypeptidase regulatory-like domain-containing protein [Natronorubrum tibetense]ELY39005.1 peptidase S8/S53 subtilisin kexin sedolisin [Natronorubrum tibetense GA33]
MRGLRPAAIVFVIAVSAFTGGLIGTAASDPVDHGMNLEGTVVDVHAHSPLDVPIEDASLILVSPDGTEDEVQTDENGAFTFEDVPGTGEEYELEATAEGYEANATTVTVDDDVDDVVIGLEGNATVSGQITDTTFETGVPNIDVSAENGAGTYTSETNEGGSYAIAVPGTGEEYTVGADPDGWGENSMTTASIGDGEDVTGVDLELTGDADVGVSWKDNRTDERLEGVTVTVESESLGETAFTGDGFDRIEFNVPSGPLYPLTGSKDGYRDRTIPMTPGPVLNYAIGGNAELTGSVTDGESGGGVEGATVTAENGAGAYSATTNADGSYEVDVLPGGQDYEVTIERDGYEPVTTSEESITDEADHELDAELAGDAAIDVDVVSERTGDGLEDVTVKAVGSDGAGPYTGSTADDGSVPFEAVSSDDTYDLEISKDGYDMVTIEGVDLEPGETAELEATLEYSASIDGTVADRLTGEPIEAVDLEVTENATGTTFTIESATDADGEYDVAVPGYMDIDTTYDVSAFADGYEAETKRGEAVLRAGNSETIDVDLLEPGEETVSGAVTDAVTDEPIANANVTLEIDDERVDANLAYETETNADGSYELTEVVGGYDYTLTAEADGFDAGTESIRVDGTEEVDVALAGNGALELDVVGEQFGDGLEGATVEATPVDGDGTYAGSHDGGGTYTVTELPSGVEYAVVVAAAGYELVEFDVLIEEPGVTTPSEPVSLDGDATLEVNAIDSLTDEGLEDVSLTIERDDDGAQFEPAETTGEDGTLGVTVPGTSDEYAVTGNATGYEKSTATTDEVDSGATVSVPIALEGDSTIEGSVSDRVTGDALGGATVTADADGTVSETTTDANGTVSETTTDANGTYEFTVVPGERVYEMTFEADGYRSNSTNATPSAGTLVVDHSLWLAHEGEGTDEEPYRIANAAELQAIGAELDAHYVLEGDVDAAEADVWHDGDGFDPIGDSESPFAGEFDGDGHVVEALTIDRLDEDEVGLFTAIGGHDFEGEVRDVGLENASIVGGSDTGGIVGANYGTIARSYVTGDVHGSQRVGGLVGWNGYEATVSDSYATADVRGDGAVGGLVGHNPSSNSNPGTIERSYAAGEVNDGDESGSVGGLVGTGGDVTDSYWDTQTTGQSDSSGGEGLEIWQMHGKNATVIMNGFAFPDTWHATDQYPTFAWEDTDPFYSVAITETNAPVTEGTTLKVTANVTNWGADGDRTIELGDFDGDEQDTEAVTLESGDTEKRTLRWDTVVSDAGTGSVTVTSGDDTDSEVVTVEAIPQQIDATVTVDGAVADNNEEVEIEVTVAGTFENPVEAATVEVDDADGLEDLTGETSETDSDGKAVFTATSSDAGVYTLEFSESDAGTADATVTFESGDPADVAIAANPANETIVADGENAITYTVAITDMNDNAVANVDVEADGSDGTGLYLNGDEKTTTASTDADGEVTFAVNSTTAQDAVEIVFTEQQTTTDATGSVTVEPGDVASVELDPAAEQTIDAGEMVDFEVTAFDEFGNVVEDDDDAFNWTNADNGTFEETAAGEYEVAAELNEIESSPTTVSVEAVPSTGSGASSPSTSVDSDLTTSVRTVGDELRADITPSVSDGVSESHLEFSNTRTIELRFFTDDTADEDRPVATTERFAIEFTESIDTAMTIREGNEPTSDDTRDLDQGLEAVGYLQIATDFEPDQFDSATIEFSVPSEALAVADGDANAVSLYHFDPDADEWRPLETTVIDETEDKLRFSAGVDSFSQFAIGVGLPDVDDDDSSADEMDDDDPSDDEDSSAHETDSDSMSEDVDDGTPGFGVGVTLLAIVVFLVADRQFRNGNKHN